MKESNNNFDELKQLLRLKRHEIPPPGYFNNFSGDVIARIRAGEAGGPQSLLERLQEQSPWLAGWLRIFETKPGVIGGFATSLCLLLLIGVVMAERPDSAPPGDLVSSATAPESAAALAAVMPAAENSGIAISTNPVISLQPVATLFGQQQNPLFQAASFAPSGRSASTTPINSTRQRLVANAPITPGLVSKMRSKLTSHGA